MFGNNFIAPGLGLGPSVVLRFQASQALTAFALALNVLALER